MSISFISASKGRSSLRGMLSSIDQPGYDPESDQIIVVADNLPGAAARCKAICDAHPLNVEFYAYTGPKAKRIRPAEARNLGLDMATCTHVCFMDDDDIYTPGAIELFKRAIRESPPAPQIFRAAYRAAGTIKWDEPRVYAGNIQTSMVLSPREKAARWKSNTLDDYLYAAETCGGGTIWHDDITTYLKEAS